MLRFVYILDRRGTILFKYRGAATSAALEALCSSGDTSSKEGTPSVSAGGGDTQEELVFEAYLSDAVAPFLRSSDLVHEVTQVGDHDVLVKPVNNVVIVLVGCGETDPLALSDLAVACADTAAAICDGKVEASKLKEFHGKLTVAFEEMFSNGVLLHSDAITVCRNAKMKPFV